MQTDKPREGIPEFAKIIGASIRALLEKDMTAMDGFHLSQQVCSILVGEGAGVLITAILMVGKDPSDPLVKDAFIKGASMAFDHLLEKLNGAAAEQVAPDAGT